MTIQTTTLANIAAQMSLTPYCVIPGCKRRPQKRISEQGQGLCDEHSAELRAHGRIHVGHGVFVEIAND